MKFVIVCDQYNRNVGGNVVLHKLGYLLMKAGCEVYFHPHVTSKIVGPSNIWRGIFLSCYWFFLSKVNFFTYKRVGLLEKPPLLIRLNDIDSSTVVIYPEVVIGNPLGAKNVVRYFLHQPGYFSGSFSYGVGDLIFKYDDAIFDFVAYGVKVSSVLAKITHYPIDVYNMEDAAVEREGVAYCVRKGVGKSFIHPVEGAVNIDGLSHEEIAAILKKAKYFYSYDLYTAYSKFAVLCGCISIVVPDDGVAVEDWYPNIESRYGLSYGLDNVEWAQNTAPLMLEKILKDEKDMLSLVIKMTEEIKLNFSL